MTIIYIQWPCGFVNDNNIHSMPCGFVDDNNIHYMVVWFCGRNIITISLGFYGLNCYKTDTGHDIF